MKRWFIVLAIVAGLVGAAPVGAQQVVGAVPLGVTVEEMKVIVTGWSVKKHMLGVPVYNEAKEKIGTIDDVIVGPEKFVSIAIIGVGGFLGIGRHDVAIPLGQLKHEKDRFLLPGATKEELKKLPPFVYAE